MRMPWENDIDWGNTATTIVKGEPMIDNYVIAELLKKYEALWFEKMRKEANVGKRDFKQIDKIHRKNKMKKGK